MDYILLIEDDTDLAAGLLFTFQEEGFKTLHAACAAEARASFKNKFDLVVLDIMLPDGNGYDLCKEIRAFSDVPILFLTSCDDEANTITALDGGGDDYVTKPFKLDVLLSRIRAHLRRRNTQPPQAPFCGGVRLDDAQGRAFAAEQDLRLTLTEYRLLSLLTRNAGLILKRGQLLDALWDGKGDFVDDNTLSVHIRHLREKLSTAGSGVSIRTVRGLGYRLEEHAT
ncbi:response regulator transcription factor [Ethanoligenens harbinense]|uniref:Stage 0 sporulation protein A homolog n=1 Tax=Ethanoligenens harbinense (strain DSM 18485 / JCM 12961 / CGMCC 1.5033 / YUAN-3) TaxID=663278 RepID=E6UA32_ETHHY|nr:response regulator transcription factor [Ethanoligenens harbinense]ADU27393.1 two component transcriptional regulator, winged helix family [Ethanoligenens harbinense YUAN-3]AVQ96452.1 DNA-binding response regulator [Ethanoligenens harbinense YUAN-3]AYF39111.1 DNA-binding response regulator [Ethanoligenens harbinense]AYF41937.1 DNA-binding response regulator [Ethanoligenens harbinense]QCN92693.1 DNA-binding response regulator [Ethanoligenens harbinense]